MREREKEIQSCSVFTLRSVMEVRSNPYSNMTKRKIDAGGGDSEEWWEGVVHETHIQTICKISQTMSSTRSGVAFVYTASTHPAY